MQMFATMMWCDVTKSRIKGGTTDEVFQEQNCLWEKLLLVRAFLTFKNFYAMCKTLKEIKTHKGSPLI